MGENLKKLSEVIMFKDPDLNNKHIQYEYALKDLLSRMLEKNPLNRITLQEIMVHEWVTMDGFYPMILPEPLDETPGLNPGATFSILFALSENQFLVLLFFICFFLPILFSL